MLATLQFPNRLAPATLLALLTTLALLYLMQRLIEDEAIFEAPASPPTVIDILPAIEEVTVPPRKLPARPPEPEPQPETSIDPVLETSPNGSAWDGPRPPLRDTPDFKPALLADGEAIVMYRPRPRYPSDAQRLGVQGFVLLELTIAASGVVSEAIVVEADPPGVFDRAAREAALKARYRPKVVDGIAMPQFGVLTRVVFEMNE